MGCRAVLSCLAPAQQPSKSGSLSQSKTFQPMVQPDGPSDNSPLPQRRFLLHFPQRQRTPKPLQWLPLHLQPGLWLNQEEPSFHPAQPSLLHPCKALHTSPGWGCSVLLSFPGNSSLQLPKGKAGVSSRYLCVLAWALPTKPKCSSESTEMTTTCISPWLAVCPHPLPFKHHMQILSSYFADEENEAHFHSPINAHFTARLWT